MVKHVGWSNPCFLTERQAGYPKIRFPKGWLGLGTAKTVFEALADARHAAATVNNSRKVGYPVTVFQAEGEYRRLRSQNPPRILVADSMDHGEVAFPRPTRTGTKYECVLSWHRKAPAERTITIGRTRIHNLPLLRRLKLASWVRRAIDANISDPSIVDWKSRPTRIPMAALERIAMDDHLLDALVRKTRGHDTVPSFEMLSGYSLKTYLFETGRKTDQPSTVDFFVTTAPIRSYINMVLYYYRDLAKNAEIVDRLDDDIPNAYTVELKIKDTHNKGLCFIETLASVEGKVGMRFEYETIPSLATYRKDMDRTIHLSFESAEAATIIRTVFDN